MDKINRMQVWIIGAVLALISAAVIWFALISPAQERMRAADAKWEAANTIAVQRAAKEADLRNAKIALAKANADWNKYQRTLMPSGNDTIDLSNLYTAMTKVWKEQLYVLGPKVNTFLRKDKKVQIQAQIALPPPPTDPNAVNQKVFVYDLGPVAVAGTFNDVLDHVERWNKFDRLVLADGLTLAGNSPRLVGTYSLRAFVFTKADKTGSPWPVAAGGTGGGGFNGFSGGGGSGSMRPMTSGGSAGRE